MRISLKESIHIKESFQYCINFPFKLYLFGSRLDLNKKGGDIDLLVLVDDENIKRQVIDLKSKIRLKIFENIPEQKIDITVATQLEMEQDEFLSAIQDKVVLV